MATPPPLRPLTGTPAVLAATGFDPWCRSTLSGPDAHGWTDGRAVAWSNHDAEEQVRYLSFHGPAAAVAELVAALAGQLVERLDRPRVTVPRGTPELLPAGFALAATDWDFRWTSSAPPVQPGEDEVAWAGPGEEAALRSLLAVANPTAAVQPGEAAARRWCVVRRGGELVAVAADTSRTPGVGHVSSVGTRPDLRGTGLAAAVMGWLTRQLLAEADLVVLGHYADNGPARRLYDRLGYADTHPMSSGVVRGPGDGPADPVDPVDPHH